MIHLCENDQSQWQPHVIPYPPYSNELPFHDVLYLIVVTISTVGYGDIAPKTAISRVVIMLMMLIAFIVVPQEINALVEILSKRSIYSRLKYKGKKFVKHIVVCGAIQEGISEFFQEFFHEDHGSDDRAAVILSIGLPNPEVQRVSRPPPKAHTKVYLYDHVYAK